MKSQKCNFLKKCFLNERELLEFLQKENNTYALFILERYFRNISETEKKEFQFHHIQPKHSNGSDDCWNLIGLSLDEHCEAHKLLYECYNQKYDYSAWCMMTGKTKEGLNAIRKQNHLNMKIKNIGFYNSKLQSELAKRPKKQRKTYARNEFVLNALERGCILQSKITKTKIIFKPKECTNLSEILEKWLEHPEMSSYKCSWLKCLKKEKFSLYTALNRSLTGHRDKKTNKAVYSIAKWRILGIFL